MAQKKVSFTVIAGPSKFDLSAALFTSPEGRYLPQFTLKPAEGAILSPADFPSKERKYWISIDGIEREDGSGESWNLKGSTELYASSPRRQFTGHYSTKTRTGHFTFTFE